jgi:tricorn protease-like protein
VWRSVSSGLAQYDFSDTGTLIFVPGEATDSNGAVLGIVNRSASATPYPMPAGEYADPRVSPDGRWAAFTQTFADGDDISVYQLGNGGVPRRLSFGGTGRYPAWSSDGTRVAFQSTRDGTASIYWQLADGTGGEPVRLTTAADGETHIPDSFSPDGRWLTYTAVTSDSSNVRLLDLGTGDSEVLIDEPAASNSVFSPDGRWIAYDSSVTGLSEVFVQPFPLTGARYQLPLAATNHHAAWAADGSELYYFPGQTRFEAVTVTTEPGFSFGRLERLVPTSTLNAAPARRRQYDVMPDGSGLLGVVLGGGPAAERLEIRIVQNWFEEIIDLVPPP